MSAFPDKPLLILDLDETLVHATDVALRHPHDFVVGAYLVYKRPFLGTFLAKTSEEFQLAIWSSASADYVAEIVRQITPVEITLQFVWTSDRCVRRYDAEWQSMYWVKDLKKVKRNGYDLRQVLIVDDTPSKSERNYGNAIYVSAFEGDPSDRELDLLGEYLVSLVGYNDHRKIEKRGWRSKT